MARKIIRNIEELKNTFSIIKKVIDKGEPIILDCERLANKRTDKQLRGYWVLINSLVVFFNENGLYYTKEMVSDVFKIKAGLFKEIQGEKIPLSISNKANRTKEEMERLINTILEFGLINNIKDCYLTNRELTDLLNFYEK